MNKLAYETFGDGFTCTVEENKEVWTALTNPLSISNCSDDSCQNLLVSKDIEWD